MYKLRYVFFCVAAWIVPTGVTLHAAGLSSSGTGSVDSRGMFASDGLSLNADLYDIRGLTTRGNSGLPSFDGLKDAAMGESASSRQVLQSPTDDPDDIYWDNSISPSIPGIGGTVHALAAYDGKLVAGGLRDQRRRSCQQHRRLGRHIMVHTWLRDE
jgi:hypothetical protein